MSRVQLARHMKTIRHESTPHPIPQFMGDATPIQSLNSTVPSREPDAAFSRHTPSKRPAFTFSCRPLRGRIGKRFSRPNRNNLVSSFQQAYTKYLVVTPLHSELPYWGPGRLIPIINQSTAIHESHRHTLCEGSDSSAYFRNVAFVFAFRFS